MSYNINIRDIISDETKTILLYLSILDKLCTLYKSKSVHNVINDRDVSSVILKIVPALDLYSMQVSSLDSNDDYQFLQHTFARCAEWHEGRDTTYGIAVADYYTYRLLTILYNKISTTINMPKHYSIYYSLCAKSNVFIDNILFNNYMNI